MDGYSDKLMSDLKEMFMKVRRLQEDAAFRRNQARDASRSPVEFEKGDVVLWWEPSAADEYVTPARREQFMTKQKRQEQHIPQKWVFKVSGPHFIVRKVSSNVYRLLHRRRQKECTAHVTQLVRYYPWSSTVTDTSPTFAENPIPLPPDQKERGDKSNVPVKKIGRALATPDPSLPLDKSKSLVLPQLNDLCLIYLREDPDEPFTVGQFLGEICGLNQPKYLLFQWYGSYSRRQQKFESLKSQKWYPGYIDPKDGRHYWKCPKTRHMPTHPPLTNNETDTVVEHSALLDWGFALTPEGRLPPECLATHRERMKALRPSV